MKSYAIRIPLPKIAYSINLELRNEKSQELKATSSNILYHSTYHARHDTHDLDLSKVQAFNIAQSWF